ncbi:hypothetical protein UFOVP655_75 [uncultured Caudovirales phage]|uniref:Uncharacterized protein n=1 Tax=uncultured Caudovirales phage TaxID=2100421 RepID=A0A6J5ND85_9CAUD|nr:hypothetical protein UFOVP655_75 [uncultured Caudovirales phage]
MAIRISAPFECGQCGQEVVKCKSNKGGIYIASIQVVQSRFAEGHHEGLKSIYPFHKCNEEVQKLWQETVQYNIESGQIVKGQTVEVVRGRKVPKGTIGKIFWVGSGTNFNGQEEERIGIETESGEKFYVPSEYVVAKVLI